MLELSMHILDIVENSIRAGADEIVIRIVEDGRQDRLVIEIEDNGKGMGGWMRERAVDPFVTTKEGKKVGMGLSLLQEAARRTGGEMTFDSGLGRGTVVRATFGLTHVDRQPLGDIVGTMVMLIVGNPDVAFQLVYEKEGLRKSWDTRLLEERFGDVFRGSPDMIDYVREALAFIDTA